MSGTVTTINTPLTGAAGTNGLGGDAPAVSESASPFSNENFTGLASQLELFPSVTGGLGGSGADGGASADGVATTVSNTDLNGNITNSTTWTPGKGGLPGGQAGTGADATLTMADDTVGTSTTPFGSSLTLNAATKGGQGGTGGTGGDGGNSGGNFDYVMDNGDGTTTTSLSAGAAGGSGGAGGSGANAGAAGSEVSGLTSYTLGGATLTVDALGGVGGDTLGISGGGGALGGDPSAGGDGGDGGNGGNATATLATSTVLDHNDVSVSVVARAGAGGAAGSGPGGAAVYTSPVSEPYTTDDYGTNGNGGDGGNGGSATATLTGNSLTAPQVSVALSAEGQLGGAAGIGGTEGTSHATATMVVQVSAPGATGSTGGSGNGTLVFTNNTITVGSPAIAGFPGELTIGLSVVNPTGELSYFPLDGGAGGNLEFSGNDLVGAGGSQLDLQLSGTGTAIVNTLNNTLSFDGSPANTMTGFTDFDLDNNGTFYVGPGVYMVHYASDPDTLVYTPQSGDATLEGVTPSNLLLNFQGFGASLTEQEVQNDTTTSNGSEFITIPNAGSIELLGFTGAIPSGDIEFSPNCFGAGTRIATPAGEVTVERLSVGGLVRARDAGLAAIKWIGRRHIECNRHPKPRQVWPVCVRAGAFGEDLPGRDLWLSPDHAVFVGTVLIPIKHLINGTSIEQVPTDAVTYYHVELEHHDLLLAEGLPAESYFDTGDRFKFENGGGAIALHPDFSECRWDTAHIWEALACAKLVVTGPELDATRALVNSRAADAASAAPIAAAI